ncbi:MAG: HAD-IA family hydrolase [Pseudomonadota bacterium]|nr:HAD-IA family hydrolase [Pseudomonadota bacterium]
MPKTFELIVFDWDGTLMDSAARIVASLRAAGQDIGFADHSDAGFRNVIGLGMQEAIRVLYPTISDADVWQYADRYRHHFLESCPMPEQLFEGVPEILASLHQQPVMLAVATGKSRKGLDRVLRHTDCGRYFQATRCADETTSKPHPQMLLELIEELGAKPETTLMVGDTEYDMEMAQRAGTAALAVTYGAHESHRLDKYQPLASLNNIHALGQWFENNLKL